MSKLEKITLFLKKYLPMYFLLLFSYNPIIRYKGYNKFLLIAYAGLLFVYTLYIIYVKRLKKVAGIISFLFIYIFTITFFQERILGYASYPGRISYFLSMLISLMTLLYYDYHKLDFLDSYIRVLAFFAAVSLPFWVINQFGFYGISLSESSKIKSLLFYTSYGEIPESGLMFRNSGPFWEPGAFAGYIILAMVFIALKNRKFQVGTYKNEMIFLVLGLLTSQSTTGYITFMLLVLIHFYQSYKLGRIVIIPLSLAILGLAYFNLSFMKEKIENNIVEAEQMKDDDIHAGRFGAIRMDWIYIKSQPLIGNGWDVKTRYRFHPQVKEGTSIGHGNGMSNIIAIWGIPFFLLWLYWVHKFTRQISKSKLTAFAATFIIVLLLQGEQFLYYPMFLSFFFFPFVYKNMLTQENKLFIIRSYLGR